MEPLSEGKRRAGGTTNWTGPTQKRLVRPPTWREAAWSRTGRPSGIPSVLVGVGVGEPPVLGIRHRQDHASVRGAAAGVTPSGHLGAESLGGRRGPIAAERGPAGDFAA